VNKKPLLRFLKPKILDHYLFGQLLLTVLFGVILFTIIWLAPDTLYRLIQYLFRGDVTLGEALTMFVYHLPGAMPQAIPIAVLLGCLFVFQRFSRQFELVAIQAGGISIRRFLVPVVGIGIFFALLHAFALEVLIPASGPRLDTIYARTDLKNDDDHNFVFVERNRQGNLDKFFMIGQSRSAVLRDFLILYYEPVPSGGSRISRILTAGSGHWNKETRQWQLFDGVEYVLSEEGVYRDTRAFREQQVRTDKYAARLLELSLQNPMVMGWHDLSRYIRLLEEGGQLQDVPFYRLRLWQKITTPLASILFALLGALLGIEPVRSNRSYGLTLGVTLVFLYSVLIPFTTNLGSIQVIPAWIIAWIPIVVVGIAGYAILALKRVD
jgi:lipopolysaccharide export system permease protein